MTVTSTRPAFSVFGATALIFVSDLAVKLSALTLPNFTALAPLKSAPLIVTLVPPAIEPEKFSSEVTFGAGRTSA